MPAFIDRTGHVFGRLTVVSRSSKNESSGGTIWVCKCICGNEIEVRAGSLHNGDTTSCGCSRIKDLKGLSFGRLTVVSLSTNRATNRGAIWIYKCSCGNIVEVRADSLIDNNTRSCGCLQKEISADIGRNTITHRASYTVEFNIWSCMLARCTNPNDPAYCNYGGRGIIVCSRWLYSFENFLTDMGYRPSSDHSIDRINNDGNYEPGNCRWATAKEQANNRRNNVFYNYNGVDYSLSDISTKYNIKPTTFHQRIAVGWTVAEAIEIPVGVKRN